MKKEPCTICDVKFTEPTGQRVVVRLGSPTFDAHEGTWYCLSEVTGLEKGQPIRVYGTDPFQAITLSLKRFRIMFKEDARDFRTEHGSSPYTMFPKEVPWVYGLDVYEKLCALIDKEVSIIEDERTRRRKGQDKETE